MSEWKTYTLDEFCEPIRNGYSPNSSEDLAYIGLEHIEQQTLRLLSIGKSSDVTSNKFKFESGDVLFGKLRPYFRKVYRPNFSGICSTDISVFRAKKNFDTGYLFYLLATKDFIDYSNSVSSGTRMPRADWNLLKKSEWSLPDLNTQQRIAFILSSLDDAIELNQQINKTLEDMAKAIFKEWFVDFNFPNATGKFQETEIGKIPVGWKVETFEDVFDADRGLSYKGAGLAEGDATPMHNLNSVLEGGGYKTIGIKYYNGEYKDKHIVNAGEVIVANTEQGHKYMLIGYPAIVPQFYGEHGIFSHHIYRLRPKPNCYLSPDFIYHLLLQTQVRDQVVGFANGTTVNMLKIEGLKKSKFAMPPKELAEKFGAIAKANRLQAEQNIEENQALINLRDTLLPKLMKGEIEININELVNER